MLIRIVDMGGQDTMLVFEQQAVCMNDVLHEITKRMNTPFSFFDLFHEAYCITETKKGMDCFKVVNRMVFHIVIYDRHIRITDDAIKRKKGCYTSWDIRRMKHSFGPIEKWDTSFVTDMAHAFRGCFMFNQDISGWDVSSVTDMRCMFLHAFAFNQDISGWDVSNVTNIRHMFMDTFSFNIKQVVNWDIRNVSDLSPGQWYFGDVKKELAFFGRI